jgi:transcriptional regulator with XRE-family HTH domain
MNLNYLYRQLKKRKDLKHFEIKPIGSAIRLKRKEMGMTLEEGAEGICSISYLSKLENNQIDPNLDFVDQLVERFGLKDQIQYDIEKYENDLIELTELLFNLEKPKRSYIETYRDREDHQARVIHLIETAITEEFLTVFDHFKVTQQFVPHLKPNELTLVLLCVCEALIHAEKFIEAYRLTQEIPWMKKEDNLALYVLTMRLHLRLGFNMHKVSEIGQYYQLYLHEVMDHGFDHLTKEMKCIALLHLAHYQSPHEIKKAMMRIDRLNTLNHLPYALSCYTHQHYDEVIALARQKNDLTGWFIIYLLSLEAKKEIEALHYVIEHKKPTKILQSDIILIEYLKTKYSKDSSKIIPYIRKNILNVYLQSDHYVLLEYLMHDTAKIFSNSQFYKEANLITTQFQLRIKALRMSSIDSTNEV